jgi:hypothetical protein
MTTNFFFTPLFCCCSGIRDLRSGIRDGQNQDPGSGIRDKHPGSATLILTFYTFIFYNNYLNLLSKNGSPKRQKAVLFTQQAGGDLKNKEKHFYFSREKKILNPKSDRSLVYLTDFRLLE